MDGSICTSTVSLDGEFRPRSEYFGNGGNFTGGSFPAQTATDADEGFIRTTVRAALNAKYTAETYTVLLVFKKYLPLVIDHKLQQKVTGILEYKKHGQI